MAVEGVDAVFGRGLRALLATRWGRRVAVPGTAAEEGFRWNRRDSRDRRWWPQGIDLRVDGGERILLVSWHRHDAATRLSVVRLRDGRRPRYRHLALVQADGSPVAVHAGGIAWDGDRILVADTFGGLRVFRLADARDGRLVQSGSVAAISAGRRRMRYSFVSLEEAPDGPRLVVGEYRNPDEDGRLVRLHADGSPGETLELHSPKLTRMQGACIVDGTWCLTTSEGTTRPGDLWIGTPDELVRHRGVLPPGPEDLARERGTRMLWSLTEQPGRRWVYRISLDRWSG